MKKRKKIGIIFIMVVGILLPGLGNLYSNPPQGKIQGTVQTEDGTPLASVSVWLNKIDIKTTTNEKGTYSLTSNLTGSLLVTVGALPVCPLSRPLKYNFNQKSIMFTINV